MKNPVLIALCLLPFAGLSSCSKDNNGQEPDLTPKTLELTAKGAEVIAYGNEFGIELFTKVAGEEEQKPDAFAP